MGPSLRRRRQLSSAATPSSSISTPLYTPLRGAWPRSSCCEAGQAVAITSQRHSQAASFCRMGTCCFIQLHLTRSSLCQVCDHGQAMLAFMACRACHSIPYVVTASTKLALHFAQWNCSCEAVLRMGAAFALPPSFTQKGAGGGGHAPAVVSLNPTPSNARIHMCTHLHAHACARNYPPRYQHSTRWPSSAVLCSTHAMNCMPTVPVSSMEMDGDSVTTSARGSALHAPTQ